ncbi:MAG: chorismate-binding protein, partial [Bifidobacteriaceae bacterium]|nr:chorismate-binding protein [Bifidobacteriaceae bacterium]
MQIYADKCFSDPEETIEVFSAKDVRSGLNRIEELKNKGFYLLGYLRYDLFHREKTADAPLIYFEAYKEFEKFDEFREHTDFKKYDSMTKTAKTAKTKPFGSTLVPMIDFAEYRRGFDFIQQQIASGNTYEVNYAYPMILKASADGLQLYEKLLEKQKTPYNAFICNDYETIMSFSPELFFRLKGDKILTKPMKGTIERGKTPDEDARNRSFLSQDTKNRTENVMIVDLLRNDLSAIAKPETIRVEKLFEVEQHKTVFQMTSEISSRLREGTTLYDILKALHPCGSVTGAPKISTMDIIERVEPCNREVYCGAIGFLHGDETIFSVPIRILQKKAAQKHFRYFSGGAITCDSTAEDEWRETIAKAKFAQSYFSLIETGVGENLQIGKDLQ